MITSVWSSNLDKTCTKCGIYGNHIETTSILSHPKVLRLVILRFSNTLTKLVNHININPKLNLFGKQFLLMSSINHHGTSIGNGHYTATVKYNSWWNVDDKEVKPSSLNCFKHNNTAYLVFYRQWDEKWDRRVHQLRSGPLLWALAIVGMVLECLGIKAETWPSSSSF